MPLSVLKHVETPRWPRHHEISKQGPQPSARTHTHTHTHIPSLCACFCSLNATATAHFRSECSAARPPLESAPPKRKFGSEPKRKEKRLCRSSLGRSQEPGRCEAWRAAAGSSGAAGAATLFPSPPRWSRLPGSREAPRGQLLPWQHARLLGSPKCEADQRAEAC